jgi:hypothetical protein
MTMTRTMTRRGRILDDLVDSNIKRLDELLEEHAQKSDATAEARFVRLNGDETPEGRSIRGYKKRCESAFLRGLDACKLTRGETKPIRSRCRRW